MTGSGAQGRQQVVPATQPGPQTTPEDSQTVTATQGSTQAAPAPPLVTRRRSGSPSDDRMTALQERRLEAELARWEREEKREEEERTRRMAREDAESEARIAALSTPTPARTGPAGGEPIQEESLRELIASPEFQELSVAFPLVPPKQLARVFKWPNNDYDPSEIFKLSPKDAFAVDDEYVRTWTPEGESTSRKKGTLADFKTPAIWSQSFLLWVFIRLASSETIPKKLMLRYHDFHATIMRLTAIYTWESLLGMTLVLHRQYYNDANASWEVPDLMRDLYCVRKPTTATPPARSRDSGPGRLETSKQICWIWNNGGCSEPCRTGRKHACSHQGCGGSHREKDHAGAGRK